MNAVSDVLCYSENDETRMKDYVLRKSKTIQTVIWKYMVFSGKEFIHHLEEGSRRIAFARTFDKQE